MKVVIFCGGQGLRMGESSASIPKPMVMIGNRPILWHIMKYYAHHGHRDFILCLGYRAEVVKQFFLTYDEAMSNDFILSDGGRRVDVLRSDIADWRITFVDTGLASNVGQRLKAVAHLLEEDEMFLATYGDGLTDAHLPDLIDVVVTRDKLAAFLCARPATYSFHTVQFNGADLVSGVTDMTQADLWLNGGYFVFRREVLDLIHEGEDLVGPPLERLMAAEQLVGFRYHGFWAPMDTLKDRHNLELLAEGGAPPWAVWATADNGRVAVPEPC
jgi:glucose-1-phosphate cytidylyltransferase